MKTLIDMSVTKDTSGLVLSFEKNWWLFRLKTAFLRLSLFIRFARIIAIAARCATLKVLKNIIKH